MYDKHFKLSRLPFTPDAVPEALFLGPGHRESLAALEWGLSEPSGFTLLVGEAGMGKTTLVRTLLARAHPGAFTVLIPDPTLSFQAILIEISTCLGFKFFEPDKLQVLNGLYKLHLLRGLRECLHGLEAERLVVIFDEAQDLADETLDQVRFLSNLAEGGSLKIILVGQPRLLRRLESERFTALNQRIGARAVLSPLGNHELADYLEYRLRAAGSSTRRLFARKALRQMICQSAGCPRRANMIAHNAMVLAFSRGAERVNERDVKEATEEYDHPLPHEGAGLLLSKSARMRRLMPSRGARFAAVAGVAATLTGYQLLRPEVEARRSSNRSVVIARADSGETTKPSGALTQPETYHAVSVKHLEELSSRGSSPSAGARIQNSQAARREPLRPAGAVEPRRRVKVRPGDTLQLIARDHLGSDDTEQVDRLLNANPKIRDANSIYPGQTIYLDPQPELVQEPSW